MDDFRFEMNVKRTWIPDGELLAGLKRFSAIAGPGPFTTKQYGAWRDRPHAANTLIKRFGSWRGALKRIGVEGGRGRRYEPAELVENLERVWREIGRPPGAKELRRRGCFSSNSYKRRWGSVRRACEFVSRYHGGKIGWAELLKGDEGRARRKGVGVDVRWKVLKRDGFRCAACGTRAGDGVDLHVDHIVPVSRGGGNEMENLRALCARCNVGRGDEKSSRAADQQSST